MKAIVVAAYVLLALGSAARAQENPHGEIDFGCESCHTTTGWSPLRSPLPWNHERDAEYPLVDAHAGVDCRGCHQSLVFQRAEGQTQCADCHRGTWAATVDPDHEVANLPLECASCHDQRRWTPALAFDHSWTGFLLEGGHRDLECERCHPQTYAGTPTECSGCHADDYRRPTDPDHVDAGFDAHCESCHTVQVWAPASFDHDQTSFALVGAHEALTCVDCHAESYQETSSECVSCHTLAWQQALDPDHQAAGFPTACESCHSSQAWAPATFDHTLTSFPLEGAHRDLDCESCHASGYTGTSTECFSCHEQDYRQVADPNHAAAGFSSSCESCHVVQAWTPADFDHTLTSFPLEGAHRDVECASCHASGYTGTAAECFSCHQQDYQNVADPNHARAGFPTTCASCHGVESWSPASFDHGLTSFPLDGAHRTVDCRSCHASSYTGTSTECFSCHEQDYRATTDPNHAQAGFPTACETCHTTQRWTGAAFDHSRTDFPLDGAHRTVDCQSCHTNGYTGTSSECFSCHEQDYRATTDPNHAQAGFPTACETCHTTQRWTGAAFDHSRTDFPLDGAHRTVDCQSCHANGYTGTSTECFSCHEQDYRATTDPNHAQAGFPTACETCHTTQRWTGAAFDHSRTDFPLDGAHRTVDCQSCHANGYTGTSTECFSCHEQDYRATTDPNHAQAGFPTACETCHSTQRWIGAAFDHSRTDFPLDGAHRTVDCQSCHANGYTGTSTECFSCHEQDYRATTDPNHAQAGFPTACETCHTTQRWSGAAFDHSRTDFPLDGAHRTVDCQSCHANGFTGTSTECFSCHEQDYRATTDPNHAQAGFPTACETCHTTQRWIGAAFDHSRTDFPLDGAHRTVDCQSCHTNGYTGTSSECFSCHEQDYRATTDPNHAQAGFPTACETCHATRAWTPASFDHGQTAFPLQGAHANVDCQSCHASGYTGTSTECFSCHEQDYRATTDPNHAQAGLPTACETCHTARAWRPAAFDHSLTAFPLQGTHRTVACADCHQNGYSGTPTDCYSCHSDDYNRTTNPNHAAAGFPQGCETCHRPTSWDDSTFDHDTAYFPIYSGKHREAWDQCTDCHVAAGNFEVFECIFCHGGQSKLDDEHNEVQGYRYESRACLQCHPDGDS